jgi:CHAT domain-containing protein/Tfp pilus assembly protein PilF
MASAYENLGQLEMAIKYYQQSFEINRKTGNHFRMAEAMFFSGSNLYLTGKYPEALQDLEIAIEIYRNLEDTIGIGEVLSQMGFVYANLGDYSTAIEKCREALKLMEQADYIWGVAGVYNTMGVILQAAGRTERALAYYEQSLEKFEELDDKQSILGVLNNLGTVNFDLKEYDKAEEYHYRALQLSRELNSKIVELQCLINLANDQTLLGKQEEALSNYESALPIARSLNSPETVWKTLVGMAENYKLGGDYDRAIEYNEEGFKIIEEMRVGMQSEEFKTSYMARERYAFEDVINMLAELHEKDGNKGYDLKAFQYAQRSKSRALIDLLVESQGRADSADYQYSQPASLEEIQSSCLDNNTVFLEYSLGDSNSYLWVITSDLHQLYKLPDRKTIQEQIETMRFAMLNPEQSNIGFLTQSGYTLYNQLIKPAEEFLSENSNLVILPDGILNYLPFEVLITREQEKDNKASYSDLPYLVKKYPISYGQSSSVMMSLAETQNRNDISLKKKNNLIAFGDPVYEIKGDGTGISIRESFSRLEHSGREVENIASLFQEGSVDIFLRHDATEENVKNEGLLAKFSYIHFATHGHIDEEKPDFSSLVLTQKKNSAEDGYLQAAEIFNLDINADLVVLSACQTGLGKMIRGEGMVGLTRAFMYAGTPSVLVSLWNVSDISTAVLMEKFYENLIKHKESKTDALRRAQLSMVRDETYAHPFYWASFVLIGEWH